LALAELAELLALQELAELLARAEWGESCKLAALVLQ